MHVLVFCTYHSVVLLALVDANKRFLTVDDGNVFSNSNIAMRLARQNIGLPPGGVPLPYIEIGDEAFPLKKYHEALEDSARQNVSLN